MRNGLVLLPILSALWFLSTTLVGGLNYPGYQHASQFISELGATGAPYGSTVSLLGFIPVSALLVLFVICATYLSTRRRQKLGLLGIGIYAATLTVAALYPCDFQCRPENPSVSQIIHNMSAVIGYLGGIAGVFVLVSDINSSKNKSMVLIGRGLGAIAACMFLLLNPEFQFVGVAQRIFELSMYTWIIGYAFYFRSETTSSVEIP